MLYNIIKKLLLIFLILNCKSKESTFEKNAKLEDWIFCNVLTFTIGEENLLLQASLDHKADFERIYFHKNIECNVWHFQKNCPASFDTPYLPL